jgi:hypothetical protein
MAKLAKGVKDKAIEDAMSEATLRSTSAHSDTKENNIIQSNTNKDKQEQTDTEQYAPKQNNSKQNESEENNTPQDNSGGNETPQANTEQNNVSEDDKGKNKKKYPWTLQNKKERPDPKYNRNLALNAHYDAVLKYVCEKEDRSIRWLLNRIVTKELEEIKKQIEKDRIVILNV